MTQRYCAFCGEMKEPNAVFCGHCGKRHNEKEEQTKLYESPDNSGEGLPLAPGSSSRTKFSKRNRTFLFVVLLVLGALVPGLQSNVEIFGTKTNEASIEKTDGLKLTEVIDEYSEFSCSDSEVSNYVICIMAIRVTNESNSPQELFGNIYMLADDKTFKATTDFGGIDYVSTDLNPGESAASVIAFELPIGSAISGIFISDLPEGGLNNAKLSLSLDRIAIP
jgi:hypothetical protein